MAAVNLAKSLRNVARRLGAAVGQRLPGRWDSVATGRRHPQQQVIVNRGAGAVRGGLSSGGAVRGGLEITANASMAPAAVYRCETPGPQLCEETWGPQSSKEEAKRFFKEAKARQEQKGP